MDNTRMGVVTYTKHVRLPCLLLSPTLLDNVNAYESTESLVDLYMCAVRGSHYKHIDQCFSNGVQRALENRFGVFGRPREVLKCCDYHKNNFKKSKFCHFQYSVYLNLKL